MTSSQRLALRSGTLKQRSSFSPALTHLLHSGKVSCVSLWEVPHKFPSPKGTQGQPRVLSKPQISQQASYFVPGPPRGPPMLSTGHALLFSGVPPPSLNWRAWESDVESVGSAGPGACVGPGRVCLFRGVGIRAFHSAEPRSLLGSQESLKERGLLPGVSIHQSASWSAPVGRKGELPLPGTVNLHYKVSDREREKSDQAIVRCSPEMK